MLSVEKRVTTLEEILAQTLHTVEQTSLELREFKQEMRQYRENSQQEMQAFKQEMQVFKEEMRQYRENSQQEMQAFKEEMRQYRDRIDAEIQESKESRRQMTKEMNQQWGHFSQALGRLAEDLVAPSIPKILRQVTGCSDDEIGFSAVRVKRRSKAKEREFDVVAICKDYVLINETKNRLRSEDIKVFAEEVLPTIREFFPEYAPKIFIGAMASLSVDEHLVRDGEKRGIFVLGLGDEMMDVLNTKDFVPKAF